MIWLIGLSRSVGLAASAGVNAFLPLLVVGILARATPLLALRLPYDFLTRDWAIMLLAVFLMIELVVDKVPRLDSLNDTIQTAVRPAAGAVLFAASETAADGLNTLLALLLGLLIAGAIHTVKMVIRPRVTIAFRGMGNPLVSLGEDTLAMVSVVLALLAPQFVPVVLLVGVFLALWLLRQARLSV